MATDTPMGHEYGNAGRGAGRDYTAEGLLGVLGAWSERAAAILSEIADEAQITAGKPCGTDQRQDIRALLAEHQAIRSGNPARQRQLALRDPNTGANNELDI